jgi:sulfatase modifying factor 1
MDGLMSKPLLILSAAAAVASGAVGIVALRGQSATPDRITAAKTPSPTTVPAACCAVLPKRFAAGASTGPATQPSAPLEASHGGMKFIPGGEFAMGSQDADARADERPVHQVRLDGFWIDQTLVTNAQFRQFIQATGYVTTAEKKPDWEEMKKQLPPGTDKPPEEKLVAASIVFHPPGRPVALDDVSQWWQWVPGADWRHPQGPGSSTEGKDDYPVVQVSWDDAAAYATWAGKRLPSEAEFEYAARGGLQGKKYAWGDEDPTDSDAHPHCNIWQGSFPDHNTVKDGYERSSPVTAFPPNGYALYDMAGNVWEWCADWYRPDTYAADAVRGTVSNPTGPDKSLDPEEPYTPKRVTRGGSFLCHASYCSSYRAAARMKTSPDSSTDHTGFRCVASTGSGQK